MGQEHARKVLAHPTSVVAGWKFLRAPDVIFKTCNKIVYPISDFGILGILVH